MGRRAADPVTPVPVLGVPASVGVRGWKTTGGDRGSRALLQACGQCSIGIQTSPGISRPPAQPPDTLSNNVTQTSSSCITKEMENTLLLTKNNNEKRAILRQKTRETKIRKEVTFKAFGGEISKDDGTYCYAKRISNDPFSAATLTSSKTKLKHCYMNGSVVDSEVIGGISVVDEPEPKKGAKSHGGDHHNADQLAKMIPLTASQGLAMPRERYINWGERQSVTCKATTLTKNSPASDAYLAETPLKPACTSLFTTTHCQAPYIDTKLPENQKISLINSDKKITVIPKVLYLNEEIRHRKILHPACPVHSRGNLANPHVTSDGTWANTSTVTKATTEHSTKLLQDRKIPVLTSVILTPQASAMKPNNPHSHTYPKLLKPNHLKLPPKKVPQNICAAVQVTTANTPSPPPSYVYTIAMRSRKAFCANTYKTHTSFSPEKIPLDNEDNTEQKTLHSIHKTQISNATNTSNISQVASKCITLSLSTNALKSDQPSHLTSHQPDPSEPREKPPSSTVSPSAGKMAFTAKAIGSAKFPTLSIPPDTMAQHSLRSTTVLQSTLNRKANPDQITQTSTEHQSVDAQIHSTPPNCSTSKPTLQMSVSSLHKTLNASQPPYAKSDLPATYTYKTTLPGEPDKNVACRSTKFNLKTTPASFLSPLAEKQNSISVSSSLQLTDTTKVLNCNEAPDTNKAHHTHATHMRHQGSNGCSALDDIPNQESNSRTAQLMSGNLNVLNGSKDHGNYNCSHVTNTQNYNSFIKSSGSGLQACLYTDQRRLARYQGYTERACEGHCTTIPPVKTNTESNAHQLPLGATAIHAKGKLESDANSQTQCSVSPASVATQTKCGLTVSHANTQERRNTSPSTCQNFNFLITLQKQAHTTPERSVTVPASSSCEGQLHADAGPECESILPSSTTPLASRSHVQPSEVQANSRADSKCCPGVPQSTMENTTLSHSHPADAVLLLPPSPQCCKSAALEQRLEAVEASLAANKDRITTLLNIIHDLETISTPSSRSVCASFSERFCLCSSFMGI